MGTDELTLSELADAAEVSPRTVRYYISEGLLPPPEGVGPGRHYRQSHLDRLRLILRLKAAYLPLREIRRFLTGMDDEDVRRELAAGDAAGGPFQRFEEELPLPERPSLDRGVAESAASYLDRVMAQPAPLSTPRPPRSAVPPSGTRPVRAAPGRPSGDVAPEALSPTETDDVLAEVAPERWVRIRVSDDVELLVRGEAMARLRDKVAWLVRWARTVFR